LEPDRERRPWGELPVHLALGRTRADRRPGDEVARVLRRDRVDELAGRGDANLDEIQEQPAGHPQAVVDPEAAVAVRIGDEPLPSDTGPRLHEIRAHDHDKVRAELVADRTKTTGVVECSHRIVDRTWAEDRDEPVVIGSRSNVQDNSTIHTDEGEPTLVGPDVTIGHNALVHSSVIARNVLIGQAAVLVGGNVIGEETIVGAGAVLTERFSPPARSLVLGVPAKVVREARPEDARWTVRAAEHYTDLARWYRENLR